MATECIPVRSFRGIFVFYLSIYVCILPHALADILGDTSLSGSTGILCEWVGHSLEEVLLQVHKQFCKRDIDGHLPIFESDSRLQRRSRLKMFTYV